jgi:hypothetical protein
MAPRSEPGIQYSQVVKLWHCREATAAQRLLKRPPLSGY